MNELITSWINVEDIRLLLDPTAVIFLVVVIIVLFVGKLINDWCTSYALNEELTKKDNKALAMSFMGYIFAIGIIIWGVLISPVAVDKEVLPGNALLPQLMATAIWAIIGILLLQLARVINDRLLLYKFRNVKEIIEDQNVGTGVVQGSAYIGSGLVIMAALHGEGSGSPVVEVVSTLVYFAAGQLAFILFGLIYSKVSRYDLHEEIEKDNVAAGVGFGMTMIAVGVLMCGYILQNASLPGLLVWFVISCFLLLVCRYLVDKTILPGTLLDEEISKDRNWGAALVEGISAISLALILIAIF